MYESGENGMGEVFFFFLIEMFIYLAALSLVCDTKDPGWGVWDLLFWLKGSPLQCSGLAA